jgi:N-acetylneuraminic acid mutarotase
MPSARSEVAVAAIADKVYVVGGFGGGRELEIYTPRDDRWHRGAPLPRAIHHAAAVSVAGKLYVLGGYANGWQPIGSVYV